MLLITKVLHRIVKTHLRHSLCENIVHEHIYEIHIVDAEVYNRPVLFFQQLPVLNDKESVEALVPHLVCDMDVFILTDQHDGVPQRSGVESIGLSGTECSSQLDHVSLVTETFLSESF